MAFEHKPGQFTLFKHDKKGNERAPDYSGDGKDLQGKAIRVAAWIKTGKTSKFMSCKFDYPQAKPATSDAQLPGVFDDMKDGDDDGKLPF